MKPRAARGAASIGKSFFACIAVGVLVAACGSPTQPASPTTPTATPSTTATASTPPAATPTPGASSTPALRSGYLPLWPFPGLGFGPGVAGQLSRRRAPALASGR